MSWLLLAVTFLPLLGALVLLAVPREEEGLCRQVLDVLELTDHPSDMARWGELVRKLRNPGPAVKVARR